MKREFIRNGIAYALKKVVVNLETGHEGKTYLAPISKTLEAEIQFASDVTDMCITLDCYYQGVGDFKALRQHKFYPTRK
ncbi:MAG: hypothetical protein OXN25_01590 [Candidatus Poribacteria bacterium]|nr:hypothetical protein [Candidatus Poribacteria bacterium]